MLLTNVGELTLSSRHCVSPFLPQKNHILNCSFQTQLTILTEALRLQSFPDSFEIVSTSKQGRNLIVASTTPTGFPSTKKCIVYRSHAGGKFTHRNSKRACSSGCINNTFFPISIEHAHYYLITTHIPSRLDPIRSIFPFFED